MIDWSILNIEETTDESVITQAYRRMLTVTNPEDNPQGFMMLRRTYEEALDYARNNSFPMENTNAMGEVSTDNLDKTIRAYRPVRLNFPNKKVNQIKILVRCDSYTEGQTNLRTFMYGLKEIGGYINYYSNYEASSFEFEKVIPEPPINKNYVITGITPYFNNGSEFGIYSRDFNYEIFYKDNDDVYHKITDNFPFTPTTNKIKVRCKFGEGYDEINIKKVDVTYKIIE